MSDITLKTILNKKITKLNSQDIGWITFIKDFRTELLSNSSKIELTPYMVSVFRNRLNDLLLENNVPYDIHWIVTWLNGLGNQLNFKDVYTLWIPSMDFIKQLRVLYDSSKKS